ncbi:hypothetical protein GY21_16565 [Cryobacterium roopkundense]|uniref:Secreted protein n=1 Tax=Cryobacterium roopkundense TaxID=1001240 RepID=A0A099J492_9MICO|nr:hypothetical protein [Cryobacterium roopkundense]KGJ72268.1 hypothetical protein GY21_16565 [Cryobacterium roopkundense]MBB5640075.1 hypothetical protein [Cryobacterium roopkundense]
MRTSFLPVTALFASLLVATLSGCSAGPEGPAPAAPPATASASASATASASAPAAEPTGTPPIDADLPGCPSNDTDRPDDTYAAKIPDVDGDGRADSQWYAETSPFRYGITTASGATFSVADGLAGPGQHSGWSAQLSNGVIVTVLDDSRGASLHTIVACEFVTPLDVTGSPYRFDMQDLRGNGTGVGCVPGASGVELNGFKAVERADGTFDVTSTQINVAVDGQTAANGIRSTASGLSASDPAVLAAQTSSCGSIPVVATSGR